MRRGVHAELVTVHGENVHADVVEDNAD